MKKEAANCEFGLAGDHPCENMDLLAHVPLSAFSVNPSAANDIWGFYDLNDNMNFAEKFLKYILKYSLSNCPDDFTFLNDRYTIEEDKKPKIERSEMGLIEKINFGIPIDPGIDTKNKRFKLVKIF